MFTPVGLLSVGRLLCGKTAESKDKVKQRAPEQNTGKSPGGLNPASNTPDLASSAKNDRQVGLQS